MFKIIDFSVAEGIWWRDKSGRRQASLRVTSFGPSEQQNVGFRTMQLVMHPASRLLDSNGSPFLNSLSLTD